MHNWYNYCNGVVSYSMAIARVASFLFPQEAMKALTFPGFLISPWFPGLIYGAAAKRLLSGSPKILSNFTVSTSRLLYHRLPPYCNNFHGKCALGASSSSPFICKPPTTFDSLPSGTFLRRIICSWSVLVGIHSQVAKSAADANTIVAFRPFVWTSSSIVWLISTIMSGTFSVHIDLNND